MLQHRVLNIQTKGYFGTSYGSNQNVKKREKEQNTDRRTYKYSLLDE